MANHMQTESQMDRKVDEEWLRLNRQVGRVVNKWSRRGDLIAYLGEDGGQGQAAAIYIPAEATVEINTKVAFGNARPEWIGDFEERDTQFEFLRATGAAFHEAMHARHSTWDIQAAMDELGTGSVYRALTTLEESRIEAKGVIELPENQPFLRACALEIVLKDMDDEKIKALSDTRQAAQLAGLALARVDAGVLEEDDVESIRENVLRLIPEPTLTKLEDIWREFQTINYPEYETERMYDLARRWDELVQEQAEENGEGQEPQPGDGEGSDAEDGDSEGSGSAMSEAMREALREGAGMANVRARRDAEVQKDREDAQQALDQKEEAAEERETNEKEAKRLWEKKEQDSHAFGERTRSTLIKEREPSDKEKAAAVTVGKELDKARYVEREVVKTASVTPPGRFRGGAAMRGRAQRANHVRATVEPFVAKRRVRTDEPKLTQGIMVDISGSMGGAMEPMAVTSWVMANAAYRINGKVATVYYGFSAFPTLSPGEHQEKVRIFDACDGTEVFDSAFRALDGKINLLNGKGARLLTVVSDGNYTAEQQRRAEHWLKRCEEAGVGVLWVGMDSTYNSNAERWAAKFSNVEFILGGSDPTGIALKVGEAAAKAITAAGQARR